ncbi:MAG: HU family DNA-binding protein [Planctomycetota bacterium]|jgi:integration host factor subunit beta
MATVTKKELVNRIAERTGQTKVVTKDIIQMFLDEIIAELGRGNRLEFREFGVFEIKERAARKAQNPRTLEKVDVPAKKVVKFKVGRLMKELVGISATPAPDAPSAAAPAPADASAPSSPTPSSPPPPPAPDTGPEPPPPSFPGPGAS